MSTRSLDFSGLNDLEDELHFVGFDSVPARKVRSRVMSSEHTLAYQRTDCDRKHRQHSWSRVVLFHVQGWLTLRTQHTAHSTHRTHADTRTDTTTNTHGHKQGLTQGPTHKIQTRTTATSLGLGVEVW